MLAVQNHGEARQTTKLQPYPSLYNLALGAQRDRKFHVCPVRAGWDTGAGTCQLSWFHPGPALPKFQVDLVNGAAILTVCGFSLLSFAAPNRRDSASLPCLLMRDPGRRSAASRRSREGQAHLRHAIRLAFGHRNKKVRYL